MRTLLQVRPFGFVVACLLWAFAGPVYSEVLGDMVFEREDQSEIESFPPSIFPHWKHRIYYRCDVCHDGLFTMEKGTNKVTMEMIESRQACGVCHNGNTAFGNEFTNCGRCHQRPEN